MKLSKKYWDKEIKDKTVSMDCALKEIETYSRICMLEAKQETLVKNQQVIKNEHYIDLLAEVVNALQEIAQRENL